MYKLIAALAVLVLVVPARGALIVTFVNRGTPVGTAGAPVATGYTGYTIRLTSTTGNITAVDLESGDRGLFGPLVQRWISSLGNGTYDVSTVNVTNNNENLTNSVLNFDSHLLAPGNPKADANYVGKINFGESVGGATFGPPGPNPPFPNNGDATGVVTSGLGGYIKGAFGINGPAQSTTFDLAYVVFANDAPIIPFFGPIPGYRRAYASVAVAGEGVSEVAFWNVPIPEPATGLLLAGGGLALSRRRRFRDQ